MKNLLFSIKNHLADKLLSMIIFAAMFAFLGYYIPRIYLTYFDKTDYYKIYSPVAINQSTPHYACEDVEVSFTKESLIDGKGEVNVALNLYKNNNGEKNRIDFQEFNVPLTKGEQIITLKLKLPCGIDSGIYYFEGVISYRVKGIEKTHSFFSEKFNILKEEIK